MPLDHQFRLAARPVGMPRPSDWTFTEQPRPEPAYGTIVVKVLHVSLDPAMRGWMNDAKSHIVTVVLGAMVRAGGAGAGGTMVGQVAKIRGCRAIGIGGGDILDAALTRLAMHARVVICGAISQYNSTTGIRGPANYLSLPVNRASTMGALVFDYADRYAEAARELGAWRAAGQLKPREVIVSGTDRFPDALLMLFRSENVGKLALDVADR